VRDTGGLSSTATSSVSVTDNAPVAALSTSPSSVKVGGSLTASAAGSTDTDATGIASYTFDFGDGTPAVGPQAGPTATHRYTAVGTGSYTVTVTVRDTAGNASTTTRKIKVH